MEYPRLKEHSPPALVLLTLPNNRNVPYREEYVGGIVRALLRFISSFKIVDCPHHPPSRPSALYTCSVERPSWLWDILLM